MKTQAIRILAAAVMLAAIIGTGYADERAKLDLGKSEFESKCAICHGRDGKGNGSAAELLKKAPTDLTALSRNNGGVFPFDRVYSMIDGREWVKAHGERDMPIWGKAYSGERVRAAEYYADMPYDMEMYVRVRILALIDYLHRLQAK